MKQLAEGISQTLILALRMEVIWICPYFICEMLDGRAHIQLAKDTRREASSCYLLVCSLPESYD